MKTSMFKDLKPICTNGDCFANNNGLCEILVSQPTIPCSFFKTEEQLEIGREEAHDRLYVMKRMDLIKKYEYNKGRDW